METRRTQSKRRYPGILISIEGIDGSGKSTLAKRLHERYQKEGVDVLLTKEPGGTPLGQYLRTIVQTQSMPLSPRAELLLFAADRAQHFDEVIVPALKKGTLVISDRMADSSIVYQGFGRGLNREIITRINRWAMQGYIPDATIYLHVDAHTAQIRIKSRAQGETAFEREQQDFIERLIIGFEKIFKNRKNIISLDGTHSPDELVNKAYTALQPWLTQR